MILAAAAPSPPVPVPFTPGACPPASCSFPPFPAQRQRVRGREGRRPERLWRLRGSEQWSMSAASCPRFRRRRRRGEGAGVRGERGMMMVRRRGRGREEEEGAVGAWKTLPPWNTTRSGYGHRILRAQEI
eukprot:563116-Hanusia_phi.AAC.1